MWIEANKNFEYFEIKSWKFMNRKTIALMHSLSPEEQLEFNCDVNTIDWD
jgi:hypothetical protein